MRSWVSVFGLFVSGMTNSYINHRLMQYPSEDLFLSPILGFAVVPRGTTTHSNTFHATIHSQYTAILYSPAAGSPVLAAGCGLVLALAYATHAKPVPPIACAYPSPITLFMHMHTLFQRPSTTHTNHRAIGLTFPRPPCNWCRYTGPNE